MRERPRWVSDVVTFAVIAALLTAVDLLPPDTSLAEVERSRALRICVPSLYPPLVTGTAEKPGFEIELAQAIAARLKVDLLVNTNSAMGRDFNPRDWDLTRAQCEMLGAVIVSDTTRSFIDTTPPHLVTGWAVVAAHLPERLAEKKIGFYAGLVGLDRIALGRFLREHQARPEIVASDEALAEGLRRGRFDAAISEALTAQQIAGETGFTAAWLTGSLERYPLAFGLWKGDLTLKRRLIEVITGLDRDGFISELRARYRIAPITTTLRL
jgi:ABC-type amino acid transport substrate-binding protein